MVSTKIRNILIGITLAAILLLLAFCSDFNKLEYYELSKEELAQIESQRKEAYEYALRCSGIETPMVPYDKITWVLIPGSYLRVEAVDGRITLKGLFNPTDSTIYMPFAERNTFWIMAHESLHSAGIIGHPKIPFEYPCRLMADQNP